MHCRDPLATQPDELLFSFQDFVRRFIPTSSDTAPDYKEKEKPFEELRTIFDRGATPRATFSPEGGDDHAGGSGGCSPLEFLDPPDPDWSFRTFEQCLDVLASLDIFQDFCLDPEVEEKASSGTTNGQYHNQQNTDVADSPREELSPLVIVLLASVAISLVILVLLGTYLYDSTNTLFILTN